MVVRAFVVNQVLDISVCEIRVETAFHIVDFEQSVGVILVCSDSVDKLLVEHDIEEGVEVSGNGGVETKLVLLHDGEQSVVHLVAFFVGVLVGRHTEVEVRLDQAESGHTIDKIGPAVLHRFSIKDLHQRRFYQIA